MAIDPHKWLYAPLEAGCVLVRDREILRDTFSFHPPYYYMQEHAEEPEIELPRVRASELTRIPGAESVAGAKQVGREGYVR